MRAFTIVIFILASACQFSENRYATRVIKPAEMVGTWVATDFAIESLRGVGVRDHLRRDDHVLTLRADGSCTLRTFVGPSDSNPEYLVYTSGCQWRLGEVGHQALQFQLTPEPRNRPYFYFAEEEGQLVIWQYAADPDAWKYLEFTKRGV